MVILGGQRIDQKDRELIRRARRDGREARKGIRERFEKGSGEGIEKEVKR